MYFNFKISLGNDPIVATSVNTTNGFLSTESPFHLHDCRRPLFRGNMNHIPPGCTGANPRFPLKKNLAEPLDRAVKCCKTQNARKNLQTIPITINDSAPAIPSLLLVRKVREKKRWELWAAGRRNGSTCDLKWPYDNVGSRGRPASLCRWIRYKIRVHMFICVFGEVLFLPSQVGIYWSFK